MALIFSTTAFIFVFKTTYFENLLKILFRSMHIITPMARNIPMTIIGKILNKPSIKGCPPFLNNL